MTAISPILAAAATAEPHPLMMLPFAAMLCIALLPFVLKEKASWKLALPFGTTRSASFHCVSFLDGERIGLLRRDH